MLQRPNAWGSGNISVREAAFSDPKLRAQGTLDSMVLQLGPGVRLGRYELLCMIGAGGMASVWAARVLGTRGFERIVAVKVLLPFLEDDPEMQNLFIQEAEIAASIQHPNVCSVFDLGEHNGTMYMVMEWVDGDTVGALLAGGVGPIRPEVAARIIADAAAGLAGAFGARTADGSYLAVLHRDISPNNILIGHDGQVKLSDFGIAKILTSRRVANVSLVRGKPSYMAPERAAGEAHDHRADVFSLGCVFFELLTCESIQPYLSQDALTNSTPFDPENTAEVSLLTSTTESVAGVDAELMQILLRATSLHPDERFATAEEMRMTIETWLIDRGHAGDVQKLVFETVRSRIGSRIEARRAAIRDAANAIGRLDASSPTGPASGSPAVVAPSSTPAASVRRRSTTAPPSYRRAKKRKASGLVAGFGVGFVAVVALSAFFILLVGRRPMGETPAQLDAPSGEGAIDAEAKLDASNAVSVPTTCSSCRDAPARPTESAAPSSSGSARSPVRSPASREPAEPAPILVPTNPYAR